MAIAWPDVSAAAITDAAPLYALRRAYAERCAAACAGNAALWSPSGRPSPAVGAVAYDADPGFDMSAQPQLARLTKLRAALLSLAPWFIRLQDERYGWTSWSNFPIAYSAADLMRGDHSLAILPAPGTPEANAAQLAVYRGFLENCAWWLRRLRYVDVSARAYYTRRSTASGSHTVEDSYRGHIEEGAPCENSLSAPTHADNDIRYASSTDAFDYAHSMRWAAIDSYDYDREEYRLDHFVGTWEQLSATTHSGLVVRNGSGLAGRLLLVPRASERPVKTTSLSIVESLEPDVFPGEMMTKSRQYVDWRWQKYSQDWREILWSESRVDRPSRTGHERERHTVWSADGLRSLSEAEEHDLSDSDTGNSMDDFTEGYISDFDGFGRWQCGVAQAGEIIPGHGQIEAIPKLATLPLPDLWDLSTLAPNPARRHPIGLDRRAESRLRIRLATILDFNDSYQYKSA